MAIQTIRYCKRFRAVIPEHCPWLNVNKVVWWAIGSFAHLFRPLKLICGKADKGEGGGSRLRRLPSSFILTTHSHLQRQPSKKLFNSKCMPKFIHRLGFFLPSCTPTLAQSFSNQKAHDRLPPRQSHNPPHAGSPSMACTAT